MKNFVLSGSRVQFLCCKECTPETGRFSGCHMTCEKYLETKKLFEEDKERIRNIEKGRTEIIGFYGQKKEDLYDGNKELKDRYAMGSKGLKKTYE